MMVINLDKYKEFKELEKFTIDVLNLLDKSSEMLYAYGTVPEIRTILDDIVRAKLAMVVTLEATQMKLNGENDGFSQG